MIFSADNIDSPAQPLPRDWARLIQKLRWIGLDHEAARLEWAVSNMPLDQRSQLNLDPRIPTDRNALVSNPIDLDQRASSGKVHNFQKKEVTSGRAALAEPLQLLGTFTVAVSAAFPG